MSMQSFALDKGKELHILLITPDMKILLVGQRSSHRRVRYDQRCLRKQMSGETEFMSPWAATDCVWDPNGGALDTVSETLRQAPGNQIWAHLKRTACRSASSSKFSEKCR